MKTNGLGRYELEQAFEDLPPESFLYDRRGPWPQPSPNHPFGEVKGVLHIPLVETINWWLKVGSRYLKDLVVYTPVALIKAIAQNGLKELSDQQFAYYFYHSCYAKYLTAELSESVRELFVEYIDAKKKYLVVDFSAMDLLEPIAGQHCEKSITLFEIISNAITPVAINLKNYVVDVTDGDLWMLAKFTAMQGASIHITIAEHPKLHFPMDAINAITKTAVPMDHILFQLLIPHFEITLKLNFQVLNNPTSLLQNKWWMIYAPYPATSDTIRDLMVVGYCGIKGNPAYNKFEYPINWPSTIHSDFGVFHQSYYKTYYQFAKNILAEIPFKDKCVTNWANYIHEDMPSFPSGVEIWENDNFAKSVSVLLWNLTLGHAADHKTYSEIPTYWNPLRMKVGSPQYKNPDFKFNLKNAVSIIDQTKLIMANRLFYRPWNITTLMEVDYSFNLPILKNHVSIFKKNMKEVERNLKTKNYMPVDEISVSIQY